MSSAASSTRRWVWSQKWANSGMRGNPVARAVDRCSNQSWRARAWPRSWVRTASSWWPVRRCRAPVVTISWGGLPGIHQASGYSSSRTSRGPLAAGRPAGRSGARSRRWARAWARRLRASTSSRASIAVVQAAPQASSRVRAAAHGGAVDRSYAAVTAGGAGAKSWARTVPKTAAAPRESAVTQHSRTVATRHCHTHSATTGSRSGQVARVRARGTGTAAVTATTLSRSRQTVIATGSGSWSEEGRLRVVRGRAVAVLTADPAAVRTRDRDERGRHAVHHARAGTPPVAQYDGPGRCTSGIGRQRKGREGRSRTGPGRPGRPQGTAADHPPRP